MDREYWLGATATNWWKFSGVVAGQGAVGGREQVFHVGWEWDGMVWV